MQHKNYFISLLLLLFATMATAQTCPGPVNRTALINLQRANVAEGSRAGQIPLTDTCGNQRYAQYVEINLDTINYTPTPTGNLNNLSEFVITLSGALWYIDWQGNAVEFQAGSGSCDEDWLEVTTNTCPDNINDSIYTQRYAAIGARLVWPTAELLVSDSTGVGLTVISGNRNARLGLYDNFNNVYSTIDQSGTSSIWYIDPTGEMRWVTAGGGTVQSPGAPFVNQFAIDPNDTPLPTLQAYLYPNTRTDTATVRNFLYTDPVGKIRSQAIDTLVQIVVDSIQADTTLQRNWYTHNGVTTDLGRNAFVKRSAWWRGLDTLGFMRFTMRPTLFTGTQFTVYNDSTVWDYINASGVRNLVSIADTGIILATAEDLARSINFWTDTVNWSSSFDPTLQIHNLRADGTYFYADSLKVVGIGQFPAFPSLNFDGTEKGFFYDPLNNGVIAANGEGQNGGYGYLGIYPVGAEFRTYHDAAQTTSAQVNLQANPDEGAVILLANSLAASHSAMRLDMNTAPDLNLITLSAQSLDTNRIAAIYVGENLTSQNYPYAGRRAGGIRTQIASDQSPFDWIQSYLPNDTTENAVSFYNRAYYWKNEKPAGSTGDTLFHCWAEDGVNAGKNPGFMTLDQVCAHCSESVVNWYNSNGTTTENTRIADVLETATWRSSDVTVDGVYPFRFELDGDEANEPEMMVWRFPAPNNDSLMLNQSDQEITFRSTNRFLFWSNEALILLGDSIQAQGIADKTKIRRLLGQGLSNSIQAFDADAVAAGAILKSDATDWTYADWLSTFSSATQATSAWTSTNAATDVNAAIVPKGTGALTVDMPDGTTTGGNARGATAVDLQHTRDAATQVASGTHSGLFAGRRNTVSGTGAVILGGADNIASGDGSFIIGGYTGYSVGGAHVVSGSNSGILGGVQDTVTGSNAFVMGAQSVASGTYSSATGALARAYLTGQRAHAVTTFVSDNPGFCQSSTLVGSRSVTGTAQAELFLDGSGAQAVLLGANRAWNFKVDITGICSKAGNGIGITTGDTWTSWHVGGIKRLNTTTTLVGTVQIPSTAQSDAGMATTTVTIDADDSTEALRIRITPPSTAGTTTVTRWVATISLTESAY